MCFNIQSSEAKEIEAGRGIIIVRDGTGRGKGPWNQVYRVLGKKGLMCEEKEIEKQRRRIKERGGRRKESTGKKET